MECVLVALAGGVCAFVAATLTLGGLRSMLPPGIPRSDGIRIDGEVAWFTVAMSLLAALVSGLAPALLSTRQSLGQTIKETSPAGGLSRTATSHNFLRKLLGIGEIALAAVLLNWSNPRRKKLRPSGAVGFGVSARSRDSDAFGFSEISFC